MTVRSDLKRFEYGWNNKIQDTLTGKIYGGDNEVVCDLLNCLNGKADEYAEFVYVCHKYGITDPKKLDKVLMVERVW